MQYQRALHTKTKMGAFAAVAGAAVVIAGLAFSVRAAASPGATFVVDADGQATAHNCDNSTVTPYTTVSGAITAAADGDTIKVCPGTYNENVTVNKELTIKGAQADNGVRWRVFGDTDESTVNGLVTIQAENVKLTGFSLTNPGQGLGVLVKNTANGAVVKKNIVKTVGSNTFAGPVVGVYLELGPDHVTVANNRIQDIQSMSGSAQGMLVGDSTSADPSLDTDITSNTITDVASVQKGAYGVQLNNGASSAPASTGYAEADVSGNTIKNLSGNWTHAIGLEGETPNVVVQYNTISELTDTNPAPQADVVGVYFEDNPFFFTAHVNENNLDVSTAGYGIAVNPGLTAHYASLKVDGQCNWWGDRSGPGAVATGSGSLVSDGVDFGSWLRSSRLDGRCGSGHRDHKDHDNDWKYSYDNDWRH